MPYLDPQKRQARQAQYRQTPSGQAAAQRSRDRFYAKRRDGKTAPLTIEPAALAQALSAWTVERAVAMEA